MKTVPLLTGLTLCPNNNFCAIIDIPSGKLCEKYTRKKKHKNLRIFLLFYFLLATSFVKKIDHQARTVEN